MRVAFVNQPFDELYGDHKNSIGLWSYRAARELQKKHDVTLFCRLFGENGPVVKEGITYHGFDTEAGKGKLFSRNWLKLYYRKRKPFFASRFYYSHFYHSIARQIQKEQFDVIHIHNFPHVVPIARKYNPDSRIILHMHCDWLIQLHAPWIRSALEKVDLVLGCSDHVVNGIKAAFPDYASKCRRLFNGFDCTGFYTEPHQQALESTESPYLLFLGRGSPEKGIHLATRAFQQIADEYPDLRLCCVGGIVSLPKEFLYDIVSEDVRRDLEPCYQKPYRDYVFEGIPEAIRKRIIQINYVNYEELVGVYQNAKALLVPTVCHEAFGMPVLEAIASGCPIVSSRCGGIPEFFKDGVDGVFFERGNLDSLVAQLRHLLNNPVPLRSEEERRNSLTLFSWKTIVSELSEHYQSLAA